MNIKKIIILLSLVSFLSCSTDVDIMDCESEQLHTCYATFNIKESSFFDDVSSRAADGSWFNAITDNLSLRFHNQDGSVSVGYAIYNKEKEIWEITYKGSIAYNEKYKVELFLVRGGGIFIFGDYFSFGETTCYYSDSDGEYIRNSNGEISIQATLKPLTGRIRFKGGPGDTFTLSGLSTSNYYDIKTGQLTVNYSPITLSIGSNGYSSYIYGNFTSKISPTMSITTDDCTFIANCPTNILNVGKSGWMKLPSQQEHDGWVIENKNNLINGHEYVDLGLPSGTLWATCNVGANKPEDFGDYFSWGETSGYKSGKVNFDEAHYKYYNGNEQQITKYCSYSNYGYNGFTDGKTELELMDDAAYVNWGTEWRMPTNTQLYELMTQTTAVFSDVNGVKGYKMFGRNGQFIFLPAASYYSGNNLIKGLNNGKYPGRYWSRNCITSVDVIQCVANCFEFNEYDFYYQNWDKKELLLDIGLRHEGASIRAIRNK